MGEECQSGLPRMSHNLALSAAESLPWACLSF
jgi:hypothetical protein